jgi:chromosome segregation ATPase
LESAIRDEKRVSARYINDLQHYKEEVDRLEEMMGKNKQREQSLLETISTNNNELLTVQDELFQFRSRHSQASHNASMLGQEIDKATQDMALITEELNSTKAKLQKIESNVIIDLCSVRTHHPRPKRR